MGITLNATTAWANSYLWSNGSTGATLNVNTPGTYSVQITGGNCGQNGDDTIVISNGTLNIDLFPDTIICKNQTIVLDAGTGYNSYSWSTGDVTQAITITQSGTYIVQASNGNGCPVLDTIDVAYYPLNAPSAQFTFSYQPSGIIQFTNTSLYSSSYSWSFSNGGTDTSQNPIHYFPCNQAITVTLISLGRCGSDTTQQTITYNCDGIEDIGASINLQIFPQPASETLHLSYTLENAENINFILYDILGKKVTEMQFAKETGTISHQIPISNLSKGIYTLRLSGQKGSTTRKVIVE